MLLLRKSLPDERHRRARLRRLRIAWRIIFRNGKKDWDLLAPITTKPWGTAIPNLKEAAAPSQEMRDSQLLYNEPGYIRLDDGDLHTLESNGLKFKEGVYY